MSNLVTYSMSAKHRSEAGSLLLQMRLPNLKGNPTPWVYLLICSTEALRTVLYSAFHVGVKWPWM